MNYNPFSASVKLVLYWYCDHSRDPIFSIRHCEPPREAWHYTRIIHVFSRWQRRRKICRDKVLHLRRIDTSMQHSFLLKTSSLKSISLLKFLVNPV